MSFVGVGRLRYRSTLAGKRALLARMKTTKPETFDADQAATDLPATNREFFEQQGTTAPRDGADPHPAEPGGELVGTSPPASMVAGPHQIQRRGGRYYFAATGAELLDRHGDTFAPGRHEVVEYQGSSWPAVSRRGLLKARRYVAPPVEVERDSAGDEVAATGADAQTLENAGPGNGKPPADWLAPGSKLPGGRGDQAVGQAGEVEDQAVGQAAIGSAENDAAADAFAQVLTATISGTAAYSLGAWAKHEPDEAAAQCAAWAAYLRRTDMSNIPPWSVPILASAPWFQRLATDERAAWNSAAIEPDVEKRERPGPAPVDRAEPARVFGVDSTTLD